MSIKSIHGCLCKNPHMTSGTLSRAKYASPQCSLIQGRTWWHHRHEVLPLLYIRLLHPWSTHGIDRHVACNHCNQDQ